LWGRAAGRMRGIGLTERAPERGREGNTLPPSPTQSACSAGASPWRDEKLVLTKHFVALRHHGSVAPSP